MLKYILYSFISLIALTQISNAQSTQHEIPKTIEGLNGLSLSLGNGGFKAGSINGWTPTLVLQDPNNTTFSTGTGYINGEVLTLNDGCATHAVVVVQQNTSGVITQILRTVPGSCLVAPNNPVSVLSTTGNGTGATFNLIYAPLAASVYAGANGAANDLFITDNTSPQPGLYGTEDTYIGHGAGGATTGISSFNTFIGLNDFGIGGGSPTVISSSTGVGTDCARNITATTGTINGIDCFGAGALKKLGSVPISNGFGSIGAFGNSSFGNVTAVGGSGSLAVGSAAGYGASSGLTVGNSTLIGPRVALNATYMNNVLILGNAIGQTALNDQDVILIGTGYTPVEPPTTTTNDYLNFNNIWTATNINNPANSVSTFAGTLTAPIINATNNITLNGQPALSVGSGGNSSSFMIGAGPVGGAGTGSFATCAGVGACASLTTSTVLEISAYGNGSAGSVTGGSGYSVAQGVSSLRSDINANHIACLGGDSCRNESGGGFSVLVGDNAGRNGSPGDVVAVGSAAANGNALLLIFGGTITVGHTLTLTLTTTGYATGLPLAYTYTTVNGDTPQTVAQAFYNKINTNITSVGCLFTPAGLTGGAALNGAIAFDFPGNTTAGCAINGTLTGNTTETLTATYSQWYQSVIIGTNAGSSVFAQTPGLDVIIGQQAGSNIVSGNQNVIIGLNGAYSLTTGSQSVYIGANAGYSQTSWYNNTYVGFDAGYSINGAGNTILGAFDNSTAQNCLTGQVFNNILIGSDVCPASSSGSNQLVIGNGIFGKGFDGVNTNISHAIVGINTLNPNAELTIASNGTNGGITADGHLGFLTITPPTISSGCTLDSTATDADGTITVNSSTTSCTLTFTYPFQTAVRVTLGDYSTNTAQTKIASKSLTAVTFNVANSAKFDYHIFQ